MTMENQSFDKKLVELTATLIDTQSKIKEVESAKKKYIESIGRKDFLLKNSISIDEVKLEKHDGVYFIVASDPKFEYVMRLDRKQAAVLADDLDHELRLDLAAEVKAKTDKQFQAALIHNLFDPLFKSTNAKQG
jgi:hypothetical protein